MLQWFETLAGPAYASALMWTFLALIALLVLLIGIRIIRSVTFGTFVAGGRNRKARLAVMDATAVDSHRRLVLVRRDDIEHLILIGGPTDVVVEQNIRLLQPARRPQQEEIEAQPPEAPAPIPVRSEEVAPEPPPSRPVNGSQAPRPIAPPPAPPPAPVRTEPQPEPIFEPRHPEPEPVQARAPEPAPQAARAQPDPAAPAAMPEPLRQEPPRQAYPAAEPAAPASSPAPSPVPERHSHSHDPVLSIPTYAAAAASATRIEAAPPRQEPHRSHDADLDEALLEELQFTLDEAPRREPDPLDDEMAKLLGELSGHKS